MAEPKIRFKKADGTDYPDWKKTILGEKLIQYTEVTTENNQYPPLTSSRKGLFLQEDYYTRQVASEDNTGYNIVPYGYFTYRHMSDDTVFHFNINYLVENGIVSTLYPVFTTDETLDSNFLQRYLNDSPSFARYCLLQKQGGSRTYMYFAKLAKFKADLPCLEEQQKIASFFADLDEVIQTSEAEVAALEKQKKGAMQKIFSQEVRFKMDDGSDYPDWENMHMNELADLNPKTGKIPEEFYYMDLGGVDHGRWENKSVVTSADAPSRAQRNASIGDCFFQSVRPYNMGHYLLTEEFDKPVVASTGFIQMRMKNGICPGFVFQLLFDTNFNKEVDLRCTGQAYPAINIDGFTDIAVGVPCLEEQQKIADFLSDFDTAIDLAKQELEKWKLLKKGLMQQMFV